MLLKNRTFQLFNFLALQQVALKSKSQKSCKLIWLFADASASEMSSCPGRSVSLHDGSENMLNEKGSVFEASGSSKSNVIGWDSVKSRGGKGSAGMAKEHKLLSRYSLVSYEREKQIKQLLI